jgi:ABC-2 type transport system ATP-binding protein
LIENEETTAEREGAEAASSMGPVGSRDATPAIEVRGVTKQFGPTMAVDDVSFEVAKGEVVGFLGPNGSGKTTTMRLITSYYTPDSGDILIDGVDNQTSDVDTRRRIGYLPENNPLYGDLLVHEYLDFVADLHGLPPKERRANIAEAVEEVGVQAVYYRPINQCSKGYRQRVGLAQAILHRPEILIMDEPTEGLDPNQRVPIRELITSMGEERTVMLSTHVLQEAEATCDRLLIITNGKIVAQGSAAELQAQASKEQRIELEASGDGIHDALRGVANVDTVERHRAIDGRERFTLSFLGSSDPRPEIFNLAKERDWVLWDLHLEQARLEDLFHTLTADARAEAART